MENPDEHALVVLALTGRLSNCVYWKDKEAENVLSQNSLNPAYVKKLVIEFVKTQGGVVKQRRETRPNWIDRYDYVYEVVVPYEGFKHGLYVEMRLADSDPDVPVVMLVGAHEERKL